MPIATLKRLFPRKSAPAAAPVLLEGTLVEVTSPMEMPSYVEEGCSDQYQRVSLKLSDGRSATYVFFPDEAPKTDLKEKCKQNCNIAFSLRELPGDEFGVTHAINGASLKITPPAIHP